MFRTIALGALALGLLALAGCSAENSSAEAGTVTTEGTERAISYEEFRDSLEWNAEEGFWMVGGDMRFYDEPQLFKYYQNYYTPTGGLAVARKSSGTLDDIWARADRSNLTYCVPTTGFTSAQHTTLTNNLRLAASMWENVANVRFVHVPSQDSNCTAANNNVKFNIRKSSASTACSAPFPSTARADREIYVGTSLCGLDNRDRIGWLAHELGHLLGFVHEHELIDQTDSDSTCRFAPPANRQVTDYDNLSVMHYPWCKGANDTGGGIQNYLFISQRDIDGVQQLYEAPTNVVDTLNGTVYARKQSNGSFYKKNGSTWTSISGASTAFVAAGNNVYRLNAAQVSKYSGSGSSWTTESGTTNSQQLFRCGSTVCLTKRNGTIHQRSSGGTWSEIGGAGAKFIASGDGIIYGSDPKQNTLWRFSSGGWANVGGPGFADIFANASSVFGLVRDRTSVQRLVGGTWTTIGGSGRQWIGVGANLYALTEDRASVWQFSPLTNTWSNVGGAAGRLYGTYALFATSPDDVSIFRMDSTWIAFGAP